MEAILRGILDVGGVSATLVADGSGRLACHVGRAIYDREVCEQLSALLVKTVDTVQIEQPDWDSIAAQYVDGKVLVRNLGEIAGQTYILAVVGEQTLSASFATVAIRVATIKLKKALAGGASSVSSVVETGISAAAAPGVGAHAPAASSTTLAESKELSSSGLSWSKPSSSLSGSDVAVADSASSDFLSRCIRELARHVGPISKVYVLEAIRRIAPDAPFAMTMRNKLVQELAARVREKGRARFLKAMENDL